jgi:hypothetical protein
MRRIRYLVVEAAHRPGLAARRYLLALVVLARVLARHPVVVVDQLALAPVARFVSGG